MKKWFKYILITAIFMFIGFNGISAKNCAYQYKDGEITFETQEGGSVAEVKYSGRLFSDLEWIYNSAGNMWKSNNCPNYILYKTSGTNKIYGSYDISKLKKLAESNKFKKYEIIDLYKVNGVKLATKNDSTVAKCCYGSNNASNPCNSAQYIFYVNHSAKTVELEDPQSAKYETYIPKYEKFKNECPSKIYKSFNIDDNGAIRYQYTTEEGEALMPTSPTSVSSSKSGTYNSGSENYPNNTKPEIDYADSCDDAGETIKLLKQIYTMLRYLIPVIIIGLGVVDFIKVVATGEDKAFKEVWSRFVKRIMIGIIILILPAILSLIINLSGITDTYGVDPNNIFCILK